MRIIPLLRCYELVLFADEADGVVGDIRHVARLSGGGAVYTPVGHFSAIPDEAEPEQPARWRVEAFLRTDIIHDPATSRTIVAMDAEIRATHYDPDLPRAIADALLRETVCTEPLLLKIWEGRMTDYVARGRIFDEVWSLARTSHYGWKFGKIHCVPWSSWPPAQASFDPVRGYPTHLGYAAIPDALSSEEASALQPVPWLEAPPQPRRTPFDSAMNVVLQSTDRVLIESVRLALGAEGIDVVLNDESGAALPFVPVRVLVSSADFARAREIVRDLVPTAAASVVQPSARRIWNLVLLALVALLLVLCGNLLIG